MFSVLRIKSFEMILSWKLQLKFLVTAKVSEANYKSCNIALNFNFDLNFMAF